VPKRVVRATSLLVTPVGSPPLPPCLGSLLEGLRVCYEESDPHCKHPLTTSQALCRGEYKRLLFQEVLINPGLLVPPFIEILYPPPPARPLTRLVTFLRGDGIGLLHSPPTPFLPGWFFLSDRVETSMHK